MSAETKEPEAPKRTRRFRKRARFSKVPRMPVPVKALCASASEEDRKRAHETCVVMLENWVGRIGRCEAAERLKVPPLRVWQLSQQAVAGMVAGLLKQPRPRKGGPGAEPEEPRSLKRRIAQLETALKLSQDLLGLLGELPAHRETPPAKEARHGRRRKRKTTHAPIRPGADRGAPAEG
mgnify:CR=1 FL=1